MDTKTVNNRDTYIALPVSIRRNTKWYKALKCVLRGMLKDKDWQDKHFHITAVFVYGSKHVSELKEAFAQVLAGRKAISLTLDKLEAFETKKKDYVISLTSSEPSEELVSLVEDLRSAAKRIGAKIEDFRLHITLGKIKNPKMPIEQIQKAISSIVHKPTFTTTINHAKYRYHEGRTIRKWTLGRTSV